MTLDDLIAYGANVEEGLGRCLNNEAMYLRLVDTVKADPNFETLDVAVREGRLKEGFEASHALKGVLGNLSITPLCDLISEICELLRHETAMDYTELLDKIAVKRDEFRAL